MTTTFETIKKILVERFAIAPADVQPAADFQKELDLDSMDALDLLLAVNEHFKLRLPEETLASIHTVSELVDVVDQHLPKKAPS